MSQQLVPLELPIAHDVKISNAVAVKAIRDFGQGCSINQLSFTSAILPALSEQCHGTA